MRVGVLDKEKSTTQQLSLSLWCGNTYTSAQGSDEASATAELRAAAALCTATYTDLHFI